MSNKYRYILGSALIITLVGCGGSGSNSAPETSGSEVTTFFSADQDGESVDISNTESLGKDIDNLFGDEDTEPDEVTSADTIGDVLNRASNG